MLFQSCCDFLVLNISVSSSFVKCVHSSKPFLLIFRQHFPEKQYQIRDMCLLMMPFLYKTWPILKAQGCAELHAEPSAARVTALQLPPLRRILEPTHLQAVFDMILISDMIWHLLTHLDHTKHYKTIYLYILKYLCINSDVLDTMGKCFFVCILTVSQTRAEPLRPYEADGERFLEPWSSGNPWERECVRMPMRGA